MLFFRSIFSFTFILLFALNGCTDWMRYGAATSLTQTLVIPKNDAERLVERVKHIAISSAMHLKNKGVVSKEFRWMSDDGVGIYLHLQQIEEINVVTLSTFFLGENQELQWERIAKLTQVLATEFDLKNTAKLQLDPFTYGECNVSVAAAERATACILDVSTTLHPSDINREILLPRLQLKREGKKHPQ